MFDQLMSNPMFKYTLELSQMTPRLLIVNYSLDPTNTIFGHQREIVEKLSIKFVSTAVISAHGSQVKMKNLNDKDILHLVINWEENKSIKNILRAYLVFIKALYCFRPQLVFFHMTDTLAAMFSPLLALLRIPQALWYAHASNSKFLKISRLFIKMIVSSTPGSFPEKDEKVRYIGQSINTELFSFQERSLESPIHAIYFGRFDPSKNLDRVIETSLINSDNEGLIDSLTIMGTPSNQKADSYKNGLERRFKSLIENQKLCFNPSVPRSTIPDLTRGYNLFIHSFEGSLDKVLLEATLLGLPVVTVNQEYIKEFGHWSNSGSSLKEELLGYLDSDLEHRKATVLKRHKLVSENHGIDRWIEKLYFELIGLSNKS
jgi:glycosyltransferase involved in cell wall biosynthesis